MDLGEDWEMGGDQERQGRPRDDGWMDAHVLACTSSVEVQGAKRQGHKRQEPWVRSSTSAASIKTTGLVVVARFRSLSPTARPAARHCPASAARTGWLAGRLAGWGGCPAALTRIWTSPPGPAKA